MPYIGKSPSAGVRQRYQYTATAGQTTFTGTDLGNLTLTYTDNNFVDVFQNGVLLKGGGTDYTATSGTSVVLATGASVSDVIEIIVYDVFSVGNFFNRTDSDSRYVNVDGDTMTGTLTLSGAVAVTGDYSSTTSGTSNLRLGVNAGNSIASGGNYNVCIGDEAGTALTTGDQNVAIGYQALDANDVGIRNVAIGTTALTSDTKGEASTAIGHGALYAQNFSSSTASNNTAVGYHAGVNVTTGIYNTIMGANTGDALTDADYNVAIGGNALSTDTKGNKSTAVGYGALNGQNQTSSTDTNNVAVGYTSGNNITTGTSNTFVGFEAGNVYTTGYNNICIGKGAKGDATDRYLAYTIGVDCIAAGYDGLITIGTGSGSDRIYNNFKSNATWTRVSDERYKKDIQDNADCGLGFINDLKTRTFKWKAKSELTSDMPDYDAEKTTADYPNKHYGLIAQEVKEAMANHNITDFGGHVITEAGGKNIESIAQSMFVYPLIKAVQELSTKVDALEAKNDALEARIKKLEDG